MEKTREVENFGETSDASKSGDLKMVKVKRDDRSLVFRISRTSKPNSDDSSIKCSSTDEETVSERIQTSCQELKIRIPKRVLHDSAEEKETVEYVPPEHQVLRDGNKLKVTTRKDVSGSRMNNLCAREDAPNLNEADLRCQPNYPVKESPKAPQAFSFCPSRKNESQVCSGMKRKRGGKPGVRATECKKQMYGRRGKPPKSPPKLPKQLSLVKPEGGDSTEKLGLMAPPKNYVWALVPKKLLESDFFKSPMLQVWRLNSSERGPRRNFVPSACGPKQAQFPNVLNTAVREKAPDEKDPKRQRVYESSGGNLNETERMLSNFLSNNSEVSRAKKGSSSYEPQVNLPHYSVFDLNSDGQASRPASNPFLPSSEVPSGDPCHGTVFGTTLRDTLTREIIVQSLQMLYSDEAVLG